MITRALLWQDRAKSEEMGETSPLLPEEGTIREKTDSAGDSF
jgi:hypothetical protein